MLKQIKIDYSKTHCPVCDCEGNYIKHGEDLECGVCGCIIETPYPYVAGIKINEHMEFKMKIFKREKL